MTKRLLLALLVGCLSSATFAQNWTVGQPVNMHLSDLILNSDGCWNQGMQNDDIIYFPKSLVTGVDHVYIVNFANPPGSVGFGAPNNVVNAGDTVYITSPNQQFPIFFTGGPGGQMDLSVYAVGTPTMPGQNHPCILSNLWFGNLLICNTGLNNNIATGCVTQTATGIVDAGQDLQPLIVLPTTANGLQLYVNGVSANASIRIFDVVGNQVSIGSYSAMQYGLDLSQLRNGVYFYSLADRGNEFTAKFVVNR